MHFEKKQFYFEEEGGNKVGNLERLKQKCV